MTPIHNINCECYGDAGKTIKVKNYLTLSLK